MQLSKAYSHKDVESKWYAHWMNRGPFCPGERHRPIFLDRDSTAQCYRFAAHGARAQQYAARHSLPLQTHGWVSRALGSGHRPCRHRHSKRRRAAVGAKGHEPHRARAGKIHRDEFGSGNRRPATRSCISSRRSAFPATGVTNASRWTKGFRAPCAKHSSNSGRTSFSIGRSG